MYAYGRRALFSIIAVYILLQMSSSATFLEAFTMLHDSFDSLFSVDFRIFPIVFQNLNIEMNKEKKLSS